MQLLFFLLFILLGCSERQAPAEQELSATEYPAHIKTIREARKDIAPMKPSLLRKITEEYNLHLKEAAGWQTWAERCLEYREDFEQVEYLTAYPSALIAGFAMHESGGCDMSASDWAGGRGFMQLTHIDKRKHVGCAGSILGVKRSEVDYEHEPLHNLLVGVCVLDDYERRLGSRPHGILAYNMGVGGVRKHAKLAGWSGRDTPPEIVIMKPHLRYDSKMKPRVYVQRIAAAAIMMDKALRGEAIVRKDDGYFTLADIPGWNPAEDGKHINNEFAHARE